MIHFFTIFIQTVKNMVILIMYNSSEMLTQGMFSIIYKVPCACICVSCHFTRVIYYPECIDYFPGKKGLPGR